ncbi:MAG: succinate--CoA ligase subunit alpha [Chloroflexi bacterium]|nr:MAG: succinate--CoA ligase subunit alpha [Chloroflexota bacterium]
MSVLVTERSRVIVQGVGREGRFHAAQMRKYGTKVVAGVKPGAGGTSIDDLPIYDTVHDAVEATDANASIIFVPAAAAADAILEALDQELELVVAITEWIPVHDMLRVASVLARTSTTLVGPNCPGVISPGKGKVGILPIDSFSSGSVGFVSRSGTLTYEIADLLSREGFGQSTCIGIGGDPIIGLPMPKAVQLLNEDPDTRALVIVGEIGGTDEEDTAAYLRAFGTKPAVAFIAGLSAPPGKRMGHAGAIVTGGQGTAASKVEAFRTAGIPVATRPSEIPQLLREQLS